MVQKQSAGNKIKVFVIAILIPLAVGALSAFLTKDNMDIYNRINMPPLAPPSWLFPVVWTILFILMGISSALIYLSDNKNKYDALKIYAVSLALNFCWSLIFFNLEAFLFAFVWLIILWIFILLTILEYAKINKTAAYLQIPYLLWVTFAGYLTFAIYLLN